jgi:protein kinase-like protein
MQPRTLGRYEILGELGRGAMGRVLLAYDPQIDRKVAIKVVQGLVPLDDAARARFLGEARSAGRLLHPGIVTLFDAGETERTPYLAMEYVQGDSLDRFCAPDALLPVPVVVELVARAAEALGYAHRSGVVHRDIKPANLMRVDDSIVKIMDFGLAGGAEAGLGSEGGLLGSPSYLAPEQIRGGAVDGRGDLFSAARRKAVPRRHGLVGRVPDRERGAEGAKGRPPADHAGPACVPAYRVGQEPGREILGRRGVRAGAPTCGTRGEAAPRSCPGARASSRGRAARSPAPDAHVVGRPARADRHRPRRARREPGLRVP